MSEFNMSRKQAAALLEKVRELAETDGGSVKLRELLKSAGIPALTPCRGLAHENIFIDNCMTCAPRWGLVGPFIKIR